MNLINLAFRFVLELIGLGTIGAWGWHQGEGWPRILLAVGLPLAAGAIWGTFNVRDDPSRSGTAPVPVPGIVRLLIELGFFGFAVWALFDMGLDTWAWSLGLAILVHYAASHRRVGWLLSR